jgi:hypothetical protein
MYINLNQELRLLIFKNSDLLLEGFNLYIKGVNLSIKVGYLNRFVLNLDLKVTVVFLKTINFCF